jgi:hypothetical protein
MITASARSLKHALRGAQKTFCFALLTNNHFSHNALPFRISHCLPTSQEIRREMLIDARVYR